MSNVIKNRKTISASKKYYDDLYKAGYTDALDYQQILFKPGKALQSRELNFLQSLIHEKIKNSNDLTYKNGSIIFGCDVTIDETSGTITVGDGIVYWDGIFFRFSETYVSYTSSITSGLSVHLNPVYETIDYSDDNNLYDPAIIYKINQSIDGADRLKITFDIIIEEDETNFDTVYPQSFQIAIINDSGVSLINRDPFIIENDKELDSEIKDGLKIRSNPLREPFSITDDNVNFYNTDTFEKVFVEIEEGSGIINGNEVISSESKIFQINKSDVSSDSDKLIEEEIKNTRDVNADLVGIYGDISYGESFIDKKTFLVDMMQPGKDVKIKVRVPLIKTVDGVETKVYKIFEVCKAEIADVYELWKNENYNEIISDEKFGIGVAPIPIDMGTVEPEESEFSIIEIDSIGGIDVDNSSTNIDTYEEPKYNCDGDWRAQLIVGWRINKNTNANWDDVSGWSNLEMMVAINKLFDFEGRAIEAGDLSKCTLSISGIQNSNKLISPRSNSDIINENLKFNDDSPLPLTFAPWIDEDNAGSEITFSIKFPPNWKKDNTINVSSISVKASNPFVLPRNLFTTGQIKGNNIPLKTKIYESGLLDKIEIIGTYDITEESYDLKFDRITTSNSFESLAKEDFKDISFANIKTSSITFDQNTVQAISGPDGENRVDVGNVVSTIESRYEDLKDKGKNCIIFHEFYEVST